jgi:hypothetical protein
MDELALGPLVAIETQLQRVGRVATDLEERRAPLQRRRLRFTALDNGLLACANPAAVQAVCDSLSEGDIAAFLERWLAQVPLPLAPAHRAASFAYQLSILQMEVSRTQVSVHATVEIWSPLAEAAVLSLEVVAHRGLCTFFRSRRLAPFDRRAGYWRRTGEPASSTGVTLMPGVPTSSSRSGRARRTIRERQAAWGARTPW